MEAGKKRAGEKQVEKEIENDEDAQGSLQGSICGDRRRDTQSGGCCELKTVLSAAGEELQVHQYPSTALSVSLCTHSLLSSPKDRTVTSSMKNCSK